MKSYDVNNEYELRIRRVKVYLMFLTHLAKRLGIDTNKYSDAFLSDIEMEQLRKHDVNKEEKE